MKLMYLFFFSSRRRHTRSKRDWSSDVWSSDLGCKEWNELSKGGECDDALFDTPGDEPCPGVHIQIDTEQVNIACGTGLRSEERRVGKECSSKRRTEM